MLDIPAVTPVPVGGTEESGRALGRRGYLSVGTAVALLACIAGASVWQSARIADALALAQVTRDERNLSTDLLLAVQDAETAQRGFLLTQDPSYLAPFQRAEAVLPQLVDKVAGGPNPGAKLLLLRQAVTAKFSELQQTVRLAQGGDLADALVIVRTNAGSRNMAIIRKTVAALESEQDGRLVEQVATVERSSRLLVAIDVAALVMVLALAGLIALGVRDYLATLREAQARTAVAYATLERNNDRLDETVRLRTAELLAINEEVQRFAYIVSHDLRAPLVNIMGFTSELEQAATILSRHVQHDDMPPMVREAALEEIPEALRFIRTSTSKMDRLINAILKLSREGRRVLTPERLEMDEVVGILIETMQHQAAVKGATIDAGHLPNLVADRLAVEQVFGNVLENALKYLEPGRPGLIRITGELQGAMACFDVTDNGRGIATHDFERVFELFRRAGDQSVPGEGIGLAHVRALVRRLGGTIWCASELGSGTTFRIRLPCIATYSQEVLA